jgi:hypothetical protein
MFFKKLMAYAVDIVTSFTRVYACVLAPRLGMGLGVLPVALLFLLELGTSILYSLLSEFFL